MTRPSPRRRGPCGLRAALAVALALAAGAALTGPASADEDEKLCKQRTKTMGCTLDAVAGTARAAAVAAGGALPGKCQIDSPAVGPERRSYTRAKLLCDDASIADTGDQMIALCREASTAVRANCRTICTKLSKIDPETGDPVDGAPCRMVVDRTLVTTRTDRVSGGGGCHALCEASIVCVCDP